MNFKEALISHLQGEKVEVESASATHRGMPFAVEEWRGFAAYYYGLPMEELTYLASLPSNRKSFRLAPRTITVNGVEVPAPESVAPKNRQDYFYPSFDNHALCNDYCWQDDSTDIALLKNGLVYLNKEDAIARAKAMLITSQKD